jgi:EAL domain-containing protein (putative c-di-GMP-specific phosphodiesterase class I)
MSNPTVPNRSPARPAAAAPAYGRAPAWRESELRDALACGQFIPFFQPKFELKTGLPVGVEVLARWRHPAFGLLGPADFIAALEDAGLITDLFFALLSQTLASASRWHASGWPIGFAINVSPTTLQDTRVPAQVARLARAGDIASSMITLEITEAVQAHDPGNLKRSAELLRLDGFKLSVDDFGTGLSGLQQLNNLPFTELKIDRALVAGAADRPKARAILEAIVGLANRLHLDTVAEGIGTDRELALVEGIGCRLGQAYLLAEPMSDPDLSCWLGQTLRPRSRPSVAGPGG